MTGSVSEEMEFVIFPCSLILQFAPRQYSSYIGLMVLNMFKPHLLTIKPNSRANGEGQIKGVVFLRVSKEYMGFYFSGH